MQGMTGMGIAASAVRFIVELLGVGAVAYWGWQTGPDGIGRVALALAATAAFVVVWAFVVAPKADNPLSQPTRDVIGTGLLLLAAGGLAVAGQPGFAAAFAAIVVIDQLVMVALGPAGRLTATSVTRR
jgi:uncharacterized protein DUF2568